MKERTSTALMVVAVLCAVLTTGLASWTVVKSPDGRPKQGKRIRDWSEYSAVGASTGSASATVVLVEFFDFQCPACKRFSLTLDSLLTRGATDIRLVRRHFPLPQIHPWASRLAVGGVCAQKLGEFDQYYHRAFKAQASVGDESWSGVEDLFGTEARRPELTKCLNDSGTVSVVQADMEAGRKLGLSATPSLLINNRLYSGAWSLRQLDSLIALAR